VAPNRRGEGIRITHHLAEDHPTLPYISAMDEGIMEASNIGIIKGFPITDVIVAIRDASYSNPEFARLAMKMASYEAFRSACQQAKPILLAPIMSLTVTVPNEFLGDIIGDLNARKSQVTNLVTGSKVTIVNANAPLTKMFGYSTDVRSLSQGRASFTMYFSHYDKIENG
jgi:elongation factor G